MKAELIDISPTKKNLDIEIPRDVVDHEIANIAQELAKRARVPGFRPGHAPVQVVKTRYRDEIVSEMMQHLLPKYFSDAVEERKLDIVEKPSFENVDYASGQPLRFKAVFEIYPEIHISNYVGVPVEQVSSRVTDAEIDSALKRLREEMAEMVPVEEDRPIRQGDFAEISFSGTILGSQDVPVISDKAVCEVGGATTLKEFSDNLVDTKVGEEKTFPVTYRQDYPEKRIAGTTVEYQVKVEAIKAKELPDINDEFAQRLGEYKTLDELKSKIRDDLEKNKREHDHERMRERLLEWLQDHHQFEVPEALIERQLEVRLNRLLRDLARQGINPQRLDVDWAKIREDQRQQAVRDVRGSLILEYIADRENITVNDEEIEKEIEQIAKDAQRPKERVREVLTRDTGLDRLKGQIKNKKTLDFLQEKANIQPSSPIIET